MRVLTERWLINRTKKRRYILSFKTFRLCVGTWHAIISESRRRLRGTGGTSCCHRRLLETLAHRLILSEKRMLVLIRSISFINCHKTSVAPKLLNMIRDSNWILRRSLGRMRRASFPRTNASTVTRSTVQRKCANRATINKEIQKKRQSAFIRVSHITPKDYVRIVIWKIIIKNEYKSMARARPSKWSASTSTRTSKYQFNDFSLQILECP